MTRDRYEESRFTGHFARTGYNYFSVTFTSESAVTILRGNESTH